MRLAWCGKVFRHLFISLFILAAGGSLVPAPEQMALLAQGAGTIGLLSSCEEEPE